MFNLLIFSVGLLLTAALAKFNKSNKLFWTFLVSLVIGYAGGSIAGKLNSVGKKKVSTTYVAPMYESTALTIYDAALPEDTLVAFSTNRTGQSYVDRDMVLPSRTLLAFNPENDIGNVDTENTS